MTTLVADIGGTKIAAARVEANGTITGEVITVSTPAAAGARAILNAVTQALRALDHHGATAVGLACAGIIEGSTGIVIGSTQSLSEWAGTDVAGTIGAALGLPTVAIGDGHAFAVGEATYGKAAAHESALILAVGTGVGGSYIHRRQPMQGQHWAAGQFGHLPVPQAIGVQCYCGRWGHLEGIGSGAGMLRWYHHHGGNPQVTEARGLFTRIGRDPNAREAITRAAQAVGTGAGGLANAFDPHVVVIAGGLSQAGPAWEHPLRAAFDATLMPVLDGLPLIISDSGEWMALRGAACHARRTLEQI